MKSNMERELQIYRTVAAMSREVLFRYDIETGVMEFYAGDMNLSQYETGMRQHESWVKTMRDRLEQPEEAAERFLKNLETGEPGFFEYELRMPGKNGISRLSRINGRTIYDDNNVPSYIVGKMIDIEGTQHGKEATDEGLRKDSLTGALDRSSFKHKLENFVAQKNEGVHGYLLFAIDDLRRICNNDTILENAVIVNVVQTVKRVFTYNVFLGRVRYDEIGVFYTGNDVELEFLAKMNQLQDEIAKIQVPQITKTVTISGGICFGEFKEVDAYEVRDRARIAQISANNRGKNRIVVYRPELENVYNFERNLEDEYTNTRFDYNLVEEAMDSMADSNDADASINELLRKTGLMYNFDRITVRELEPDTHTLSVIARWVNVHSDTSVTRPAFATYELVEKLCAGKEEVYVNVEDGTILCTYTGIFGNSGVLDFKSRETGRSWSDREIKTFKLLTKLISAYLLNMRLCVKIYEDNKRIKTHDSVTGFANYELFLSEAEKYIQQNPQKDLAVFYAGMKDFPQVNSQYSRELGDEILKGYADELVKVEDRMVIGCRRNADNFVALINRFDSRGNEISSAMIDRMNQSFRATYAVKCPEVDLAINAGVVFLPKKLDSLRPYVDKALLARDKARADDSISYILA